MLPAISADLPVYQVPPERETGGRSSTKKVTDSGPAAIVNLSVEQAQEAASAEPGSSLYGPDGQFVESAAQGFESSPQQAKAESPPDPSASLPRPVVDSGGSLVQPVEGAPVRERELDLADFDATIPPAAREELRALADRVDKTITGRNLQASEYRQKARLMHELGRYDEAKLAQRAAEELEQGGRAQDEGEEDSPAVDSYGLERAKGAEAGAETGNFAPKVLDSVPLAEGSSFAAHQAAVAYEDAADSGNSSSALLSMVA